jgi:hypothetical protein
VAYAAWSFREWPRLTNNCKPAWARQHERPQGIHHGFANGSATTCTNNENQIANLGSRGDQIGAQMIVILDPSAFSGTAVNQTQTKDLINQGNSLLAQATCPGQKLDHRRRIFHGLAARTCAARARCAGGIITCRAAAPGLPRRDQHRPSWRFPWAASMAERMPTPVQAKIRREGYQRKPN